MFSEERTRKQHVKSLERLSPGTLTSPRIKLGAELEIVSQALKPPGTGVCPKKCGSHTSLFMVAGRGGRRNGVELVTRLKRPQSTSRPRDKMMLMKFVKVVLCLKT
jgi:hypothetical protein